MNLHFKFSPKKLMTSYYASGTTLIFELCHMCRVIWSKGFDPPVAKPSPQPAVLSGRELNNNKKEVAEPHALSGDKPSVQPVCTSRELISSKKEVAEPHISPGVFDDTSTRDAANDVGDKMRRDTCPSPNHSHTVTNDINNVQLCLSDRYRVELGCPLSTKSSFANSLIYPLVAPVINEKQLKAEEKLKNDLCKLHSVHNNVGTYSVKGKGVNGGRGWTLVPFHYPVENSDFTDLTKNSSKFYYYTMEWKNLKTVGGRHPYTLALLISRPSDMISK